MNQERYEQIDALAQAALKMGGAERLDFLHRACGSDQDLFQRVNVLLRAYETASDFLERPAFEAWARDLAQATSRPTPAGCTVDRYVVTSQLGAGGIGEVWLAKDAELGREVALKFLSPELGGDSEQARRFRQEARAASSLSHPNLVTVYDIGEFQGMQFIAQECISGKTVREALAEGPLSAKTAAGIAAQIAAGLTAAHAAGVVHRDIKPENVMIRPDGVVKVVDFGIARFLEQGPVEKPRNETGLTRPGMILGTARYMSPEQARGLQVDGRSDIFSLGVVMYEMLAGSSPFTGSTPSDVIAAILTIDPVPISRISPGAPAELERIVRRCLAKNPDARYPSAADLHRDLENWVERRKGNPKTLPWALGISTAIAFVALALVIVMRPHEQLEPPFSSMNMTRLATMGEISDVTISRDGRLLAYVAAQSQGASLLTREFSGANERIAVTVRSGELSGISLSPDDNYLYYRRKGDDGTTDLFRVPVKGGPPERIVGEISGAAALSPDGKQVAFIRLNPASWEASLVVANSDGSVEATVRKVRRPQYFDESGVAWAPDGQSIALFAGESSGFSEAAFRLVEVDLRHPGQRVISQQSVEAARSCLGVKRRHFHRYSCHTG